MFSLEKFYEVVYENLLAPLHVDYMGFTRFGSSDPSETFYKNHRENAWCPYSRVVVAYDQEPIHTQLASGLWNPQLLPDNEIYDVWRRELEGRYHHQGMRHWTPDFCVFANSEHSEEKRRFVDQLGYHDWYYFFHGFAALDWYGNIPYRTPIDQYSRLFITFNNLYTKKRSYRLTLVAELLARGLAPSGHISMNQQDIAGKISSEIFDSRSEIHPADKKMIFQTMLPEPPRLVIDTDQPDGTLSADDNLETLCRGLWHIVTETIYYDDKRHLTEKIFKPIVARRPFILAAAPGNLAYLRSYGFQTFDQWIDERYDDEPDPGIRMRMIVDQVERLCRLSDWDRDAMYRGMQPVLQHNYQWFYGGGFRGMITDELVDNFRRCVIRHNAGRQSSDANWIDHSHMDWADIRRRLSY